MKTHRFSRGPCRRRSRPLSKGRLPNNSDFPPPNRVTRRSRRTLKSAQAPDSPSRSAYSNCKTKQTTAQAKALFAVPQENTDRQGRPLPSQGRQGQPGLPDVDNGSEFRPPLSLRASALNFAEGVKSRRRIQGRLGASAFRRASVDAGSLVQDGLLTGLKHPHPIPSTRGHQGLTNSKEQKFQQLR